MKRRDFLKFSIGSTSIAGFWSQNLFASIDDQHLVNLGTSKANTLFNIHGNGTDTTELWLKAFDAIQQSGEGYINAYGTHFISSTLQLPNVSKLHIHGINCHLIKQNPGKAFTLISGQPTKSGQAQLYIENLKLVGDWDSVQSLSKQQNRGIALKNYSKLTLSDLHIAAMRNMSLTANNCDQVTIRNCTVERSARDAINASGSRHVLISGCNIRHTWDDAIAVHVPQNNTDPTNKYGIIISNNQIEDCKGIKVLGGENIIIANNNLMRPQLYGIYMGKDERYQEGLVPHNNVIIEGNIISDMIRHEYIGVKHDIHTGIFFNDHGRALRNIQIANNIISKTKPSGKNYRYSDWGYGKMYRSNGWHDPVLNEPHVGSGRGIRIHAKNANDKNEIRISNNTIKGISNKALIKRSET